MIQAVLLLETILVLTSTQISIEVTLAILNNNVIAAIISLAIPTISWFLLKPLLKQLQIAKHEKRNYLQLKYNDQIFWSLLQKQKSILEHSTEGLGITIGNPEAENTIVKVCNPYCGPCASAHPELEKILEVNKNVKARIIFTSTNDEADPRAKPVKHFLAIAELGDTRLLERSLCAWYSENVKDYSLFAQKYSLTGDIESQGIKVLDMYQWCKDVEIWYTPTFFINSHEMPKEYEFKEISYFIDSL
jgi:thiol-disulfide isomerase/thioredoxin